MTDHIRETLQSALGAGYTLLRELSGGGMSRVFLARDERLHRSVVVKVLSPELAEGLSADRFAREIKVAAALQDPRIVPVLTAGEADGLPYYTMPFVEGESLRARLQRGPLPLGESLAILRDMTLALEYAHGHGVIHRDIKPDNVLLSGRTALVADFGIAKAVSAARTLSPDSETGIRSGSLTSVGQSLGTPAYMAPEQAVADPTDCRADLYALGMVAYEMLAGRHPFADKTSAVQLMAAQVTELPMPLAERVPTLPASLASLVMRCLAKDPVARPQSAEEVLRDLDALTISAISDAPVRAPPRAGHFIDAPRSARVLPRASIGAVVGVAVLVLAALAAGVAFVQSRRAPSGTATAKAVPSVAPPPHSIAVLPFENMGDTADAYFVDGMSDALRGKLTEVRAMRVVARGSSVQYRGTSLLPQDIARELGVRFLLTGTVRFAGKGRGKRVHVSPELVEVGADGSPRSLWQAPMDAGVQDVFRVQGEVAAKVIEQMQLVLGDRERTQLVSAPTPSADAYDAYLRGEARWDHGANTDDEALLDAAALFEQALAHDGRMVDAWISLSRALSTYVYQTQLGDSVGDRANRSLAAARKAIALAPLNPSARAALAAYYSSVEHDDRKALREITIALQETNGDASLHMDAAWAKGALGLTEDAVVEWRAATLLDPKAAFAWDGLGVDLMHVRRLDEARLALRRAVALAPASPTMWLHAALVELADGNLAAARRLLTQAKAQIEPAVMASFTARMWDLGWALDSADQRVLLSLGPADFGGDLSLRAYDRMLQFGWMGDTALSRMWGDSASRYARDEVRRAPDHGLARAGYALALAYARKPGAVAEAEVAVALAPLSRNVHGGAMVLYSLARTYLLVGDYDKALVALEQVMRAPFHVTPRWLRIDPTWKALHGDPRFQRLTSDEWR